jgi:hypothetical protein
MANNQPNTRGLKTLVFLLVMSLLLNAYQFYRYTQGNSDAIKTALTQQNDSLMALLEQANLSEEHLRKELSLAEEQIKNLINENLGFEEENTALASKLDEQKVALTRTKIRVNQLIAKAKEGDPTKLLEAKAELEKLKDANTTYVTQIDSIKQEYQRVKSKLAQTETEAERAKREKEEMDEKLKNSSLLKVTDLEIFGIQNKRGKKVQTDRSNRIDEIVVAFKILGGKLTKNGTKTITIRILGTNNEVLTNDNDVLMDSDQLISMKKTINFNGEPVPIKMRYSQKADYKSGRYTLEILNNGELVTRSNFIFR